MTRSIPPAALLSALFLTLAPPPADAENAVPPAATAASTAPFGVRLAAGARAQTATVALYTPAYVAIPYPGGDVPAGTGVCTDVVVRAYRTLGIDLQVAIHDAGVGSGDTNIDHRRVEVQRKFFAARGSSQPITTNGIDYAPGDIVTYYLPYSPLSKTHVAIVSDQKTPGGIPLVIHNRGLGVQEEDWLFAGKITGHYRYSPSISTGGK